MKLVCVLLIAIFCVCAIEVSGVKFPGSKKGPLQLKDYKKTLDNLRKSKTPITTEQRNEYLLSVLSSESSDIIKQIKDYIPTKALTVPTGKVRIEAKNMWLLELYVALVKNAPSTIYDLRCLIGYVLHQPDMNEQFENDLHKSIIDITKSDSAKEQLSNDDMNFIDKGLRNLEEGATLLVDGRPTNLDSIYPSFTRPNIYIAILLHLKLVDREGVSGMQKLTSIVDSLRKLGTLRGLDRTNSVYAPLAYFVENHQDTLKSSRQKEELDELCRSRQAVSDQQLETYLQSVASAQSARLIIEIKNGIPARLPAPKDGNTIAQNKMWLLELYLRLLQLTPPTDQDLRLLISYVLHQPKMGEGFEQNIYNSIHKITKAQENSRKPLPEDDIKFIEQGLKVLTVGIENEIAGKRNTAVLQTCPSFTRINARSAILLHLKLLGEKRVKKPQLQAILEHLRYIGSNCTSRGSLDICTPVTHFVENNK